MAKIPHEALHHIFRDDPSLFSRSMKRVLGEQYPEVSDVAVIDTALTTIEAVERRADTILKAVTPEGEHLLVIEPQTSWEHDKVRSWAFYLSFLENKYRLPAILLVITSNQSTAAWARGGLTLGPPGHPSMRLLPRVIDPGSMPFITDVDTASEDVVFAVLALLTHRHDPDIEKALHPVATALASLELRTGTYWAEFVEGGLGEGCAKQIWRKIMKTMSYGYVSEIRLEGRAEGRAEALAESVLLFLDQRGVELSASDRELVAACSDTVTLEMWLLKAPYASSADELFAQN